MIKNKISKFLNKSSTFLVENKFEISLFFIIFILLYFQHNVVSMYFDDYGNASLSYSYWVKNVDGTDYTLSQLLEWAGKIYNGWGGRILYAIVFIIPLLKHGIEAYMFVQTIVITLIIYFIYKVIRYYSNDKKYVSLIPIILFVLYTCIDMSYLRHGIYWASSSVLYIWPLLPFFALIYFYISLSDKLKNNKKFNKIISIIVLVILAFFTTFSQEQIGVGLLAFIFLYIFFHHLKQWKKHLVIDLPLIITTVISYIILFTAPGNWARMNQNVDFAKLNALEKILKNFPRIIENIFLDEMNIFIYILCFGLFFMIYKVFMKYKNETKKAYLLLIPALDNILEIFVMHYLGMKYSVFFVLNSTLWLLLFLIVSLFYFNINKKIEFCSFLFCAAGTIFCLVFSPTVGGRTGLPFMFFIILFDGKLLIDMVNDNKFIKIITSMILIYLFIHGGRNYINTYDGYRNNYSIMRLNDTILRNYNKKKDGDTLTLYNVEDVWYGSTMPYEEPSMDFWIKEYYDIPQNVNFEWNDIYEKFR